MASNIAEFLKHKNILITGSTGFLAKTFIEKILREQPFVGCLFVLIRAPDLKSAKHRLQNEVIYKDLFKILQEQQGKDYESFMFERVVPVVGDTTFDNLGITDQSVREELWDKLDILVNTAANTNFDERYDIALNVNTMGTKNALEFAKRCRKLQLFLHVSTAYVSGNKCGVISERPLQMGETLSSSETTLDIQMEMNLAKPKMEEEIQITDIPKDLKDAGARRLKELGLERARKFGWPNTYTFTKAMGEMLVGHLRGDLPVVIIRPTIIESTYAEPFPGWMEGSRTIDTLIIGHGKGRVTSFLANEDLILDVIPVDMVVNAMIAAMAKHAAECECLMIYHVSTSTTNPLSYSILAESSYQYFSSNPCTAKDGRLIKVEKVYLLQSMASFRRYMGLRFKIPLEALGVANKLLCQMFARRYNYLLRKYNFVMYLAELYEPYSFFQGRFNSTNTERLLNTMTSADRKRFDFDAKCIDWVHYFLNIHIPGVIKYVLK